MRNYKGRIHSFESFGTLDGPSIRYVVFLQGCPLHCKFCHNPDTWPSNGGEEYTAGGVFDKVMRCRSYIATGGVTLSGGEPLLQVGFCEALLELFKSAGIHTAIDTSGCLLNDDVKTLLEYTDLCLLDIKMTNEDDYEKYIGGSLEKTLEFLEYLDSINMPVWIRQVIVPGINDTIENYDKLKELVNPFKCIEKVELLPFRKLCLEKYENMGLEFSLKDIRECTKADIERIQKNKD
jgi:pyruvate formate lyase activating enzyme